MELLTDADLLGKLLIAPRANLIDAARSARALLILDDFRRCGLLHGPAEVDRGWCELVLDVARRRGVEVGPLAVMLLLPSFARQLGFTDTTPGTATCEQLKITPA